MFKSLGLNQGSSIGNSQEGRQSREALKEERKRTWPCLDQEMEEGTLEVILSYSDRENGDSFVKMLK
jgi:hypothetical protein